MTAVEMSASKPIKDAILKNGLKWNSEGTFRGIKGIWELVIDRDTNTIVHLLFKEYKWEEVKRCLNFIIK